MVDISSQEKKINIKIQSGGVQANVGVTQDTAQYYSEKAREWATSNRIVDGVDYSSKYYAGKANESALNAQSFAQSAQDSYNNFQQSIDGALSNIDGSVQTAITTIDTKSSEVIDSINSTKTTILNDIEFVADGEKEEIRDIIDTGKDELKETIGDVKVLTTLEIGTISFTQGYIDESKGLRRCLNKVDNIILQDRYPEFTKWLKNSVSLNPNLACTEAEWQTELATSANNFCDKYVIDDEAGTIRLPKYPEYIETNKLDSAKARTVITNYVSGANGYRIWSDGYCEQWGQTSSTKGSDARTVTFSKAFSNANYNLTLQTLSGGSGNRYFNHFQCTSKSASSFTAYASCNENVIMSWRATGYLSGYTPTSSLISSQERLAGTYFIQVATGAETEDNIINEIELNNPFFLGMSQYFETAPNNSSWLKSEGQWNAKAIYPTIYDWALVNANNNIEGFKLVTDTYTDYDYVINTSDETFRLPLLNGSEDLLSNKYESLTLEASGTTYTAPANGWVSLQRMSTASGQYAEIVNSGNLSVVYANGSGQYISVYMPVKRGNVYRVIYTLAGADINFRFSYAQGNGSLYFYVGETVQNANLVNVGRIQETYATKYMVDGQWVNAPLQALEQYSFAQKGEITIDLSSYLPNDGYSYEVFVGCVAQTGSTSGNNVFVNISNEYINEVRFCTCVTRTSSSVACSNTMLIPIGIERNFKLSNVGTACTLVYVECRAYRRIGTNL